MQKQLNIVALVLACVLIPGLLFVALLHAPSWRLDLGAAGDVRYLDDFYHIEYDVTTLNANKTHFRWSSPQSHVLLYGFTGSPLVLRARIHSDGSDVDERHHIQVKQGNQHDGQFYVLPGWRTYHLLLPPHLTNTHGAPFAANVVQLAPHAYEPPTDDGRELGVPIDAITIEQFSHVAIDYPLLLWRTLLLTWLVVVLGWVCWLLNQWLTPRRTQTHALFHVSTQMMAATLLFAAWAWWHPVTLAWAWQWAHMDVILAIMTITLIVISSVVATQQRITIAPYVSSLRNSIVHRVHHINRTWWGKTSLWRMPLLVGIPIVLAHSVVVVPMSVGLQSIAVWLICGVPGALLARYIYRTEESYLAQWVIALSGGIVVPPLLLLALQAIPGAIPYWALLFASDALTLTLGVVWFLGKQQQHTHVCHHHYHYRWTLADYAMMGVLLLATWLRVRHVGSAEFQGDEGQPMLMAVGMVQGVDDVLLLHRKGPMEILLPAVPMAVTHHITEWSARLPFAVAGVVLLLACYLLARHLLKSSAVGVVAAMFLALDGFSIGFSRIVQYQNIVILMTVVALWACWRFYEEGLLRHLSLAAICVAVGLLSHYDAIFGIPAMAWLVVQRGVQHRWRVQAWVSHLALPAALGGSLLASFYVPFVLHEHFQRTVNYLVTMRIGDRDESGMVFHNLLNYIPLMSFYNTTFQVAFVVSVVFCAIVIGLIVYETPRRVGVAFASLMFIGTLLSCIAPSLLVWHNHNIAVLLMGVPVIVLALLPNMPLPYRIVVIWFGVPYIAEAFLIAEPNTHFYTMHMAAALLGGIVLVDGALWLHRRRAAWVLSPVLILTYIIVLLSVPYSIRIFLQQFPEYERSFPDERPPIYVASYGDDRPRGGYFGFPHRDGWKVIGELYRQGVLQGNYDSNQKSLITTWYIRNAPRGGKEPMYYFAVRVKGNLFIPRYYHPFGSVFIDDNRILDIYSREPLTSQHREFHLHAYETSFDNTPIDDMAIQWQFLEIVVPKK